MAYNPSIDTDDDAVPEAVRQFLRRRVLECAGFMLFSAVVIVGIALATWSVDDPSFNHATDQPIRNALGYPGAVIADELMQLFGLGVILLVCMPLAWSVRLFQHHAFNRPVAVPAAWIGTTLLASGFLSLVPVPSSWSLIAGLGGNVGDIAGRITVAMLSIVLKGEFPTVFGAALLLCGAIWMATHAVGSRDNAPGRLAEVCSRLARGIAGMALSVARMLWLQTVSGWSAVAAHWLERRRSDEDHDDIFHRLAPERGRRHPAERLEPALDGLVHVPRREAAPGENDVEPDVHDPDCDDRNEDEEFAASVRITRTQRAIKQGKKIRKDSQPSFGLFRNGDFELPSLTLLAEPKRAARSADISDDVLQQNARMLEGVLDDFGVKGQIMGVKPGPVVTLYELEPAPGIKSSRVISLADDIARSMSAVSARVAVVQGRNAIGIELPNSKRETVYLRELLASEAFERSSQHLALALGKNIGGEPIFADLARMPHLLIAGTTGSGKSVGINTMILSLIYRLPPERCKLIMIDPKMLELSVYEGIPHLLAPVVTDPRKAVVALKWAVREMEDRYRKMSKVGVRNIDGYNARLLQASERGERVSRTVQTGFDTETGEPVFEREHIEMSPMPYIVVIIDEMADLMMVAGKDIEGAVQRLAQMARAAGIHVVMATQRPSVDVITGTIKANFPTRVSFQVTSKIDSRTILGEQGAEQLLGQGDMLYMAGGGRISRLHGPFVSDEEVEKIVRFLKSQGSPEYVDAVTEEPEEFGEGADEASGSGGPGGSGDDLYDQAVAVVLRDKKVSTSYVQRRLQIGYNKAASLIERMEKEGLISAANATGKREILVPGDSARA